MGRSPFVSGRYGFGRDEWIQEMVRERQAREREAAKKLIQPTKLARDTLELSSRQSQQPGPVQFAPVPILVSGIDYTV